jgi:two-component system, cell cycle sensor histidine kinase and response regulator CckA
MPGDKHQGEIAPPREAGVSRPWGLLILCASILGLLWAALIFDARRSEDAAIQQASRDVGNLTTAFREHIHRTASAIDQLMITMLAAQAETGDPYRIPSWIESSPLLQGMALQVSIAGPDGLVRASTLALTGRVDVSDRPHFRHHIDPSASQPYISVPVKGKVSNKWSIQFTRRISGSDGSFGGIIVVSVDPKYFSDFFDSVDLGANGSALLAGLDGVVRARRPAETKILGQDIRNARLFDRLKLANAGTYQGGSTVDGIERIFGYSTVPGYPLVLGVGMGVDDVLAASRRQRTIYFAVGGGLSAAIIGLTWFLVRESERRRRREMAVHAEEKLREQKQLLDTAVNNMRDGLVMMDANSHVVVMNQRYLAMYGLSPATAKPGCHLRSLLEQRTAAGNFSGDIDHYIENIIGKGRVEHVVVDLPDGRTISIANSPMPEGGTVSTHEDITARRQAERAAAAAEEQARAAHRRLLDAVEVIPEGIALFDAEDRYVLWNRRYLELYPETAPQIQVGRRFEDVLRAGIALGQYPDAKGREEEWISGRLALHNDLQSCHEQHLPSDRWLRVEERRTSEGGRIGVRIDITELKQREASFRLLFEGNPLPMFVYDLESLRFLAVNDAAVRQFGYSSEQLLARRVPDIWAIPDREKRISDLAEWGDYHAEDGWQYRKSNGSRFEASIYSRALRYQGRSTRFVAVIDSTDRLRAERDRDRNRELLDRIIEGVPTAIFVKAATGRRFIMTNPAGEKLFGMPRAEIMGRTAAELLPEQTAEMIAQHDRALLDSETPLYVPDHPMLTPRNGERMVTLKRIAIRDRAGVPQYLLTFIDDVTERKAVDAQLRQAQKMEAVGNMTGGLAHDFNNLLTVIIGNLDLLRDDVAGNPAAEQRLETILNASERGADLTRQMLAFSRRQPLRSKPIDVNALLDKTIRLLKRALGENVTITLHLATELPAALVDETQLETAIVNIAINARDAMPEGGTLTLETQPVFLDESYATRHPEVRAGEYTCIAITDTGKGMPANVLERIFEPFFTTKEDGKGTGLGLSMVYGFVKQSGGHISVYSEPGRGTAFKLFLPVAARAISDLHRGAPDRHAGQTGAGEVVLAVDDNAEVRATAVHHLRALGYNVLEAASAQSALEILNTGEKIDLLFTDIVMPGGVNGKELATRARRLRPGLKVLFTSGFPGNSLSNGGELDPADALLSKPYRNHELALALQKMLGSHSTMANQN